MTDAIKRPWRSLLRIHPACDLLPPLPEDELRALGEDIREHGLRAPLCFFVPRHIQLVTRPADPRPELTSLLLLDGRSRLDAMELFGIPIFDEEDGKLTKDLSTLLCFAPDHPEPWTISGICVDPFEFVVSANLLRRHLTTAQRKELIATLLGDKPERSDRQIAALVRVDHKTVGKVRSDLEVTGEIPQLTESRGKDGKTRPRGRLPRALEALRKGAKRAGVTVDEYVEIIVGSQGPPDIKRTETAAARIFYTGNPDAALDPGGAKATLAVRHVNGAQPPDNSPPNLVSPDEIKAKLGPLVDELLEEIPALGALSKVRRLARQIKRQIAQWSSPEHTEAPPADPRRCTKVTERNQ